MVYSHLKIATGKGKVVIVSSEFDGCVGSVNYPTSLGLPLLSAEYLWAILR